jgi:hypothetical protein
VPPLVFDPATLGPPSASVLARFSPSVLARRRSHAVKASIVPPRGTIVRCRVLAASFMPPGGTNEALAAHLRRPVRIAAGSALPPVAGRRLRAIRGSIASPGGAFLPPRAIPATDPSPDDANRGRTARTRLPAAIEGEGEGEGDGGDR